MKKSKLKLLAEIEGYENTMELLEVASMDSVVPGICTNPGCDYTTGVEPDCYHGYCEICNTQSVKSALALAGII